jgi:hypothetical protein
MKINKQLNLVIPVEGDTGTMYVHSTPLARAVFEQHYKVFARTFTMIMSLFTEVAGPRVALMTLRDIADQMGVRNDVEQALIPEIRRSTNVLVPIEGGGGYETVMYQIAVDRGVLDEEDASEVDNALVFFIVSSAMLKRAQRMEMLDGAMKLWGAQITSLDVTAYAASLKTSTKDASTGGTGIHVSIQS